VLRSSDLVVISLCSRSHLGGGFDSRDGQIEAWLTVGDPAEKRRLYRQSPDAFQRKVAKRQGTVVLVAPFPCFEEPPAQVKLCEPAWFRRPPADCRHVASVPLARER
jgi:hypothetical protein